ncbi:extensin-like [Raphanus sativus]|uniref:Extensin-like n=1 Tax=Raphanus sativus TaxID=3726 RepID=A0A9W3C5K2_RAPSA|nr:extensin-like [Raphanus sativus]
MKAAILSQTRVINFVEKDISEMWPKWDSEVDDVPAENIIKVMYDRRPWKWTMDCWEVTGTKPKFVTPSKRAKEMVVEEVEEDNQRPRKKARKEAPKEAPKEAREEAPTEAREEATEEAREEASWVTREELENMFKGLGDMMKDGFKKCIREIRKISDRLEAVEKKVGVTNQATPQAPETGVSNKQPTPQAPETGVSNKQTTPQKDQPTLQTNHPTPPTRQPAPQKAKPTPQKAKPTPQTKQPAPQTKQPAPQTKQPAPQTKKPSPQKKQPSPLPKERLLPEDTADEAISVYKILPEDKADGVTSKEIVPLTSTDQPSFASNDQQPSFASTDPSVPVSEPSLVVLDQTAPTASVRARSERTKKPAPTQISPYTAERRKLLRVGKYNPFPTLNRPKMKELADWLKTDP